VPHYYFDSSALVKRYVAETGTPWVNSLWDASAGNTLYTVRVSGAEIIAALFLRVRTGTLTLPHAQAAASQFKIDFRSRCQILEPTEQVIDLAMMLAEKHGLRGYDAIQLAASLALQSVRLSISSSPIIFVCADNRLNAVAIAEALHVETPNTH
jgi:predicted nucleic acid-binding protein